MPASGPGPPAVSSPSSPGARWPWTAAALAAAGCVAAPILVVVSSLATPAWEVWAHLGQTQLGELLWNTARLLIGVGLGVLVLGIGLAWLVVGYDFPGRGFFEWALVLPLALPAYVIGFVVLGILDFAGPVQTALRAGFGPETRLPDLRGGGGVGLVMTLVFYPYVYTLARTALLEQSPELFESARALGRRPLAIFLRVTLPLARPALVAGVTLACMEALADFGTVATFGYRTLTEAVYRIWHGMFDRPAATQVATLLLGMATLLILIERGARGRARYAARRTRGRAPTPLRLAGVRAAAATTACATVFGLGFGLPVTQLVVWALVTLGREGLPFGFGRLLGQSLGLATAAALVTGALAVLLGYAARLHPSALVTGAVRLAALGYALPGAVIAVGVLVPALWLDAAVASVGRRVFASELPLLATGSGLALLFAYVVRFLALGVQTVESSLTRIPHHLDEAARSLGARTGRTLREVHLPLLRRGLLTALALVFVDVMKEMPATLLLRPLGLDTLAIAVWQRTAEALWAEAAIPALAIVAFGLVPVAVLIRAVPRAARPLASR